MSNERGPESTRGGVPRYCKLKCCVGGPRGSLDHGCGRYPGTVAGLDRLIPRQPEVGSIPSSPMFSRQTFRKHQSLSITIIPGIRD